MEHFFLLYNAPQGHSTLQYSALECHKMEKPVGDVGGLKCAKNNVHN